MSDKWKLVVEKLLTKAEDGATTQAERESLISKATELMAKFGIEEQMLDFSHGIKNTPNRTSYDIQNPYGNLKKIMLNQLSISFGCVAVDARDFEVFGFADDLDRVRYLYNSLLVQLFVAMSKTEVPAGYNSKAFRNSFAKGFISTVTKRVQESVERAKQSFEDKNKMSLVLRTKYESVIKAMMTEFPNTTTVTKKVHVSTRAGLMAGRAAGTMADIGQTRITGGKREISGR